MIQRKHMLMNKEARYAARNAFSVAFAKPVSTSFINHGPHALNNMF